MKKIMSIIILLIATSNLLYAGSLSVDAEYMVPNEAIIKTFKEEEIPSGIYITPLGDKSKWKLEVKTKDEYIAWATIFSANLYLNSNKFSGERIFSELQRALNEDGTLEEVKNMLKVALEKINSVTYDVVWNQEDENLGAILLRYEYSSMYITAIPFRVNNNKKIQFLYENINTLIPEVKRFWLTPFYTFPNKEIESVSKVTDKKVLNQNIEKEITSYDNEKLNAISNGYIVRYSSFSKNNQQFGEKYVYFMFFGKNGYTYRISCSRQGNLDLNVYAGSGNFLYYTIPDLSKPDKIFSKNIKTGKLEPLELHELADNDKETLEKIDDILKIFKEFQSKGVAYFESETNGTTLNIDIEPIPRVTSKKVLNQSKYIESNFDKIIKNVDGGYVFWEKDDRPLEDQDAYFLHINFGDDQYCLSCLRTGVLSLNAYEVDYLALSIPNLEKPEEIYRVEYTEDEEMKYISLEANKLTEMEKEHLKNMEKAMKIFRKVIKESKVDFGIKIK